MQFNRETIELFKQVIKKEGQIYLPAEGKSMYPLINKGDICKFIPVKTDNLKKGDVVLYHLKNGKMIAHRYLYKTNINGVNCFFFKGDTNMVIDQPVKEQQIIGKLTSIRKSKKTVQATDLTFGLWAKAVFLLPCLPGILRKYVNWKMPYPN